MSNNKVKASAEFGKWFDATLRGASMSTTIDVLNTLRIRSGMMPTLEDANVLAAAPDMLEALEGTMEMLRAIRDRLPNEWNTIVEKWRGKDSPSLAVDVWDANKAAIAKAKGGAA